MATAAFDIARVMLISLLTFPEMVKVTAKRLLPIWDTKLDFGVLLTLDMNRNNLLAPFEPPYVLSS